MKRHYTPTIFKGVLGSTRMLFSQRKEAFDSPPPFYSMYVYISLNRVKRVYIQTILINHFQTSIQSA